MSGPNRIKQYSIEGLRSLLLEWGEPAYRANQLLHWLYAAAVSSYQEMSDLPFSLRLRLEKEAPLITPQVLDRRLSADGSLKYLLELWDGSLIETVAIPSRNRLSVCFSTQVGCALGCAFCTTGIGGLVRSLDPGEMVDQLLVVSRDLDRRVDNAVAMGEGEPFANYEAALSALRIMNASTALGIGARHLTVSTCGLIKQIERFAQEPEQFTLAVSLHSAVQSTRDLLMPSLCNQPLDRLRDSLLLYAEITGRRPSLEVTLMDSVNDTPKEVSALLAFSRGLLCHVNLIPFNKGRSPDADLGFKPSSPIRFQEIAAILQDAGIACSFRRSRGSDIQGACGQLKGALYR